MGIADFGTGPVLASTSPSGVADLSHHHQEFRGANALHLVIQDPRLTDLAREAAGSKPSWIDHRDVTWHAPLPAPSKIVAIGLNYADHTDEAGLDAPASPLIFAKFPSSIIGAGEPIVVDEELSTCVDFEVELAVVIGADCGPSETGTLDHVFGYTIANDVSARDLQSVDGQWVRAKSLDTFCPLGPVVVTPDELSNPQNLGIGLYLNGESQQESNTADMFFDITTLLTFLTSGMTLKPGDIVLTGTPPGVGAFQDPPRYLSHGDSVTAWIDEIGALTNPVVGATSQAGRR